MKRRSPLREQLLTVALKRIRKQGAHAMTLRSVAKEVGCSPMASYRHFPSKEALIAAISKEGFDRLRSEIEQAIAAHPENPLQQLEEAGRRYIALASSRSEHLLLMFGRFVNDFKKYPELEFSGQCAFESLVRIIVTAQTDGLIAPGDPIAKAVAAWSIVHGFSMLYINGHLTKPAKKETIAEGIGVEELGAQVSRMIIDGLAIRR